jgi:hypothetical protein
MKVKLTNQNKQSQNMTHRNINKKKHKKNKMIFIYTDQKQ